MRPDPNQWAVSAAKPEDYDKFDSLVEQKLLNRRINMGYSRSNRATERVHETFVTEEEAKNYAIYIQLFGATDIKILPPHKRVRKSW